MRVRTGISVCWTCVLLGMLALAYIATHQKPTMAAQIAPSGSDGIEVLEVRPNFYMLIGAGANVALQVGSDGAVVVDSGSAARAGAVLAAIRRLTSRPIRYIINTNGDDDHVGGNDVLSIAGQSIFPSVGTNAMAAAGGRASILAEEHVQTRMLDETRKPPLSLDAAPTITYSAEAFETQKNVYLNGQAIQVLYQPAAHTDGDSVVFFRRDDVLVLGDLLDTEAFPRIDLANGGTLGGLIASLNRLMGLAVEVTPLVWQDGGTLIIPGHGRLSAKTELVDYRDMLTIIRDRVQAQVAKGMTLRQIQDANPTQGYRSRFGSESGSWTTEMFVDMVYRSVGGR